MHSLPAKIGRVLAAGLLALAAAAPAAAQEFVETRFHRVHLRNGNFIDGHLLTQTDRDVTLKLKFGEMTIRRDLIARVEYVKIRDIKEKPVDVPLPNPPPRPPEPPRETSTRPDPFTPPTPAPAKVEPVPVLVRAGVKQEIESVFTEIRGAAPDERYGLMRKLLSVGADGPAYIASRLESLDEQVRGYAAEALRQAKSKAAVPVLKNFLRSKDAGVRTHAVQLIGDLGDPEDVPALYELLDDGDAIVRGTVLDAVLRLPHPTAFEAVSKACSDPDPQVCNRAVAAVFLLGQKFEREEDVQRVLEDAVDRTRGDSRVELAKALGKSGRKGAWPLLARLLRDESGPVRAAAAGALAELAEPESERAVLDQVLAETEPFVKVQLAIAAQKLRISAAIDPLIAWLRESDAQVKDAALRGLRSLTGQNFAADYDTWLEWWQKAKTP